MDGPANDLSEQKPLIDPAATDNLIGFFALLLAIDIRNNPQDYQGHTTPL
jgi:hypothetical protein